MSSDPNDTLDYAQSPNPVDRRRTVRWLIVVIALKLALVAFNTLAAFDALPLPSVVKMIGVGVQIVLTLAFLFLLFKLTTR